MKEMLDTLKIWKWNAIILQLIILIMFTILCIAIASIPLVILAKLGELMGLWVVVDI